MSEIKNATQSGLVPGLSKEATLSKINYKEYPEFMFAMLAAFLPESEGDTLRQVAGKVMFKSEDKDGNTYRNGLLHSFDDMPALRTGSQQEWYKNGKRHRDGDMPAVLDDQSKFWYKNGLLHREGDLPAAINRDNQIWSKNGFFHRDYDRPAIILGERQEWWVAGRRHRDGGPAIIDPDSGEQEWWTDGELISEFQE
jgi:hypothetical protein